MRVTPADPTGSPRRGEMENRIKEQFSRFSDRTSTAYLRSNQLRLYLSSMAYLLLESLRRLGLKGTQTARAQCPTIRLKLLKVGAAGARYGTQSLDLILQRLP